MTISSIFDEKQQYIFELEDLADKQLEYLSKQMPVNNACIQIIKNKQRYLVGAFGFSKDNNPRLLRGIEYDQLIYPIVTKREMRIVSDTDNEPNFDKKEAPFARSWICAPLIVNYEVKGLLIIDHYESNLYTYEKYGETVKNFAYDVADKIYQCFYYVESKRRTKQLETLIQIGNEITSKIELDEEELFSLVEEYAREALNIQNVTISIINDAEKICTVKASRNGEVQTIYTEDKKNIKKYTKGWEPRNKNEGKGKIRYVIENNRALVLYAQYILDENDIDHNKKVLLSDNGERYKFSSLSNEVPGNEAPDCWIGVPIRLNNKVIGTINAFSCGHEYQFAAEYDSQVLESLADKTAIALDNIIKYKETQKLIHAIKFTHAIILEINLSESKIVNLIHKHASEFMDTENMYIALYDEYNDEIRFGLIFEKGKDVTRERPPRKRKTGKGEGKTEYIIRTGESLFHPTRKESEEWYTKNNKTPPWDKNEGALPPSPSWIGVPLLLQDEESKKILGAIVSYHPTEEGFYSKSDIKILQSIATSAAIALQNADKYNKSEQWAFLGQSSATLAHRISNKGGMIKSSIADIKEYFSLAGFNSEFVMAEINKIEKSNRYLLKLSDLIFISIESIQERLTYVDVVNHIDNAIENSDITNNVKINRKYKNKKIPKVIGSNYLTEAFLEIINNATDAICFNQDNEMEITIDIYINNGMVNIVFIDTGRGISDEEKNSMFEIFNRKNDKRIQGGHKGYGLWWVKIFIEEHINGKIDVISLPVGTKFIISLPILLK